VRNLNHGTQFEKRTQSGFVNSMCQAMDGKVKSSDGRPLLLKESFTEDTHAYVGQVIREARG
jgi:hypothetical protein